MRHTKIIGLVAIAAIGVMALVGASSAMATGETSWCKVRQIPCQAANLYPGGTHFKAEATNVELLSTLGAVVCASSVLLGNLLNELANPLLAEITALTYTNCTLGKTSCELKSPAIGHLLFLRTAGYAGTMISHNTSTLLKCAATFIHCVFGGLRVLNFTSTGGGTEKEEIGKVAETTESKDEVKKEEESALCPATANWDSRYVFSLPLPIYLSS